MALSSPTRAAVLTGRNHHSVGTGVITEMGTAYPGYTGQIPKSASMVSEILRQNGYSTAFIGKNHNIPDWETSVSGPYDRWLPDPASRDEPGGCRAPAVAASASVEISGRGVI